MYDVIVIGAGPAGLSAALMLGRCRRRVLVCDTGRPRNATAGALHGFLSRDGTAPLDLLRMAREQMRPYETVELRDIEVTAAEGLARLDRLGIKIREERVVLLDGTAAADKAAADTVRIVFATGEPAVCRALFFNTGQTQQSELARQLGCEMTDKGTVWTGKYE